MRLGAETLDLIIGSDRGLDKLKIYKIGTSSPPLTDITDPSVGFIFNLNQVKICAQDNWILAAISWRFIGSFALEMFSVRHDLLSAVASIAQKATRRARVLPRLFYRYFVCEVS